MAGELFLLARESSSLLLLKEESFLLTEESSLMTEESCLLATKSKPICLNCTMYILSYLHSWAQLPLIR